MPASIDVNSVAAQQPTQLITNKQNFLKQQHDQLKLQQQVSFAADKDALLKSTASFKRIKSVENESFLTNPFLNNFHINPGNIMINGLNKNSLFHKPPSTMDVYPSSTPNMSAESANGKVNRISSAATSSTTTRSASTVHQYIKRSNSIKTNDSASTIQNDENLIKYKIERLDSHKARTAFFDSLRNAEEVKHMSQIRQQETSKMTRLDMVESFTSDDSNSDDEKEQHNDVTQNGRLSKIGSRITPQSISSLSTTTNGLNYFIAKHEQLNGHIYHNEIHRATPIHDTTSLTMKPNWQRNVSSTYNEQKTRPFLLSASSRLNSTIEANSRLNTNSNLDHQSNSSAKPFDIKTNFANVIQIDKKFKKNQTVSLSNTQNAQDQSKIIEIEKIEKELKKPIENASTILHSRPPSSSAASNMTTPNPFIISTTPLLSYTPPLTNNQVTVDPHIISTTTNTQSSLIPKSTTNTTVTTALISSSPIPIIAASTLNNYNNNTIETKQRPQIPLEKQPSNESIQNSNVLKANISNLLFRRQHLNEFYYQTNIDLISNSMLNENNNNSNNNNVQIVNNNNNQNISDSKKPPIPNIKPITSHSNTQIKYSSELKNEINAYIASSTINNNNNNKSTTNTITFEKSENQLTPKEKHILKNKNSSDVSSQQQQQQKNATDNETLLWKRKLKKDINNNNKKSDNENENVYFNKYKKVMEI